MKKTMRILSLFLVLTVFEGMAMGSGSSSSGSSDNVKPPSSVASGGTETESKPSNTADQASTAQAVTIEEAVLLDQNDIKIAATGFDGNGSLGPSINLLIENNGSKPVTVQARNASVNGYMTETMMSADVAGGKKANDSLTFMRSDLETAGITVIADMEFSFHIFDSETWDTVLDSEPIKINTSAAEGFTYTYDDSGNVVYDENGVQIVVKGLSESGSWLGPAVVVYIRNTSGRDFTVQARDVSINGFMVESVFSSDVVAGKHAIDTITFLSSDLENNGIEKIDSVELSFHVFDMTSFDTIVDTAPVTIDFS